MRLQIAQDTEADEVLTSDPFALTIGMLLDQQFPMERAFAGPAKVLERFGTLDPARLAAVREDGQVRNHRDWPRRPFAAPMPAVFA